MPLPPMPAGVLGPKVLGADCLPQVQTQKVPYAVTSPLGFSFLLLGIQSFWEPVTGMNTVQDILSVITAAALLSEADAQPMKAKQRHSLYNMNPKGTVGSPESLQGQSTYNGTRRGPFWQPVYCRPNAGFTRQKRGFREGSSQGAYSDRSPRLSQLQGRTLRQAPQGRGRDKLGLGAQL